MNKDLQAVLNLIQQSEHLSDEEKKSISKSLKDADKEFEIANFKLDRTEKVKRTTAILLEETIEELENKRKAVEIQNRELEIESSLERVRTVAMSMNKPDDMLDVCRTISEQLELLKVKEIRNVQTAIFYEDKGTYMNYEYYAKHNKTFITETSYTNHEIHQAFADKMLKGNGEFMVAHIKGDEVKDWIAYQKTTNVFIDDYLNTASSVNYYWFSLGSVALGISTYDPLSEEETNLFKRFLKVFELSYRRYLDIEKAEAQAYEAKVEASLEKVRAAAMSMNKPDDLLNICETLYKEFSAFGFADLRNAMINIHNDENKTFVNYDYSDEIGKSTNHLQYDLHPVIKKQIEQIRTANDAFSETVFEGKDLAAWKKFRKKIGEKDDPRIKKAKALYYYFYSIRTGAIGISTFTPVREEKLKLLKRFRNVFNLSYQRYTDLALAEAQAREAQIELALERVRARTMAMQKSDELKEAAALLFQQVKSLRAPAYSCGYNIWEKNEKTFTSWMSSEDGSIINAVLNIPLTEDANFIRYVESKQKGEQFFVLELRGERMQEHYQYLKTIPAFEEYFDYAVSVGFALPETQIHHLANFSHGNLLFITLEPCPEFHDVFKRFAAVFEQTYTRFLDLQKSEAQARESQIQLALERVRARTMAMQKSDELAETASVLFKQLIDLGIKPAQMRTCAITTLKTDEPIGECWITSPDGEIIPHSFMVPYDETSAYKTIYAAWKNGEKFLVVNLSGDALIEHLNFLKKYAKIPTQQFQALPDQPTETFTHAMFFSQGYLFIISNEPLPQYHDIFKRFGAIFQQTYTRFLDLKKAEAQSREAQIELGLERVRARAMAMQKSDELSELVDTVFKELTKLNFALTWCIINIIDESSLSNTVWAANPDINKAPESYYMKFEDYPFHHAMMKGWKERKIKDVYILEGQEKKIYDEYLFNETEFRRVPAAAQAASRAMEKYVVTFSFSNFGGLQTVGDVPLSDANLDILSRFGKVFDLTYTRFNDLKQAEAQARESQIQLALERVRARTMAMQKSDELQEVVNSVYERLNELEVEMDGAAICTFIEGTKDYNVWIGDYPEPLRITFNEFTQVQKDYNAAIERREELFTNTYSGEMKKEYIRFLLDQTVLGINIPEEQKQLLLASPFFTTSLACTKNTVFQLYRYAEKSFSKEENDILKRFANVFEQSYTRFLDLQKAEAQAREAQIQLALERVRARTMAMQKSDELSETVFILFQQFKQLGEIPDQATIGIINEEEWVIEYWVTMYGNQTNRVYKFPINEPNVTNRIYKAWKEQKKSLVLELSGKELYDFANFRESMGGAAYNPEEKKRIINVAFFSKGLINVQSNESRSAESILLLERFAGVFEQTYTRFLDLQKAEVQAREAQIEAALEKVRSRSLAMHTSDELGDVVSVAFQKLKELGVGNDGGVTINILTEGTRDLKIWSAAPDLLEKVQCIFIPYFDHRILREPWDAHDKGLDLFTTMYSFEEKNVFYKYVFEHTDFKNLPVEAKNFILSAPCLAQSVGLAKHSSISIYSYEDKMFSDFENDVLKRFAKVFEQAYVRFLDLQKAEAQAREAKIEAALERTRTQSMIMQHSKELDDTLRVFHEQVLLLGINSAFSFLWLPDEKNERHIFWAAWAENVFPTQLVNHNSIVFKSKAINYPLDRNEPATAQCLIDWKSNEPVVSYHVPPAGVENYFAAWQELIDGVEQLKPAYFSGGLYYVEAFMKYGCFGIMAATDLTEDEKKILGRFAIEFERTYTRFLDLQKAEAQAREAKIEAALERVRSRTMGMQKSEELKEVIQLVYEQFVHLNIHIEHTGFVIDYKTRDDYNIWVADPLGVPSQLIIPYFDSVYYNRFNEAKEKGEDFFATNLGFEEKNRFYQKLFEYVPGLTEEAKEFYFSCPGLAASTVLLDNVGLYIENFSGTPYSDEENATLMRFGKVFQQTYTRFRDLQKAEAQAREAQIEAALERVRARTMAMQNSDELAELVATVFTELNRLEFALTSCIIWINNPELLTAEMWVASAELNKPPEPYYIKPFRHPYFKSVIDAFKEKNKKWVYEMKGEEKKIFQQQFFNEVGSFPTLIKKALEAPESVVYSASFYNFGALEIVGTEHVTDEKFEILHRLGKVFDMSYTRFNDLKQAEAQAQEARIETALERVRSRTLAMQKSDELAETAAVLFRQLILLGIAPNRLYIGIIKDDNGHIEFWVTDEDGSKVSTQFTGDVNRNASMKKMYGAWKEEKKSLTIDMHGKELEDYFHYLADELNVPFKQGLSQKRRIQSIAFFGKGFIGIASPDEQPEATISLLERFAAVFNLTYTRFNDLKVAEAHAIQAEEDLIKLQTEKKRAEDALTELRTTQAQLIQSEKMASLGELTAGIAHEIQNPLNFVNNFSEVNTELIAEMKEEIDKGNIEEVRAIANDIADNEQKINHHGKRADAIVKGMLQHSRSSSATKEPTDINKLADEYLRLAYHGLRAKDKTFNATLKTDYDDSIGYLNIVPQDIGRVILNLITNAFYVINEKKIQQPNGYEPTISISTKKINNIVELTVKDNGNGVPKKVLDKIFQPFFTTKPTGEGTGLGLSLSYDIIKAHGGEIKVETKEGEGSEFIIQLPF